MEEFDPKKFLEILLASRCHLKLFPFVYIPETYIRNLCQAASEIFLSEPCVLEISPPIIICGDTHGQFIDTIRILDVCGHPDSNKYLFLGDYVDRGSSSVENIVLLLTLKCVYPHNFFLLRGNHEAEEISTVYGFRDECERRYSFGLYAQFMSLFMTMPLCAVVGNSIFCVHGGISKDKNFNIETLKKIERPLDSNALDIVVDMLWSDPNSEVSTFEPSPRGVSSLFGKEMVRKFLKKNGFSMIVRSHEFCQEGLFFPFGPYGGIVTIFSAANYCGTMNNSAVMHVDENLVITFKLFRIESMTLF